MTDKKRIWLSLGSNLGDRLGNLQRARMDLESGGLKTIAQSSVYETAPWGYQSQNAFLNTCMVAETELVPYTVLTLLKSIETILGRTDKGIGYADRSIDIDILFYGTDTIHQNGLQVPHPRIAERSFVLIPLAEIAPLYVHPVLKKTIKKLLLQCPDSGKVVRMDGLEW